MPSQRQIDANPRSAQRSTGLKTPQGNYKAARNRSLHGFRSRDPLLPDEAPVEFAAFALRDGLDEKCASLAGFQSGRFSPGRPAPRPFGDS